MGIPSKYGIGLLIWNSCYWIAEDESRRKGFAPKPNHDLFKNDAYKHLWITMNESKEHYTSPEMLRSMFSISTRGASFERIWAFEQVYFQELKWVIALQNTPLPSGVEWALRVTQYPLRQAWEAARDIYYTVLTCLNYANNFGVLRSSLSVLFLFHIRQNIWTYVGQADNQHYSWSSPFSLWPYRMEKFNKIILYTY